LPPLADNDAVPTPVSYRPYSQDNEPRAPGWATFPRDLVERRDSRQCHVDNDRWRMKLAGQPLDITSGSHFDQFEQRPVALLVNHHKYIAFVSDAVSHAIIVRGRTP
jgi:hypothetical protein